MTPQQSRNWEQMVPKLRSKQESSTSVTYYYWLDDRNISSKDIRAIAVELGRNSLESQIRMKKVILEVKLDNNNIGDNGCMHISKMQLPHLRLLMLDGNNIGDDGCHHLSKMKSQSLQALHLSCNRFGRTGMLELSIGEWPSLLYIYAWHCKLSTKEIFVLKRTVSVMKIKF